MKRAYVAFAALLLAGCAALGIAPADTFNKRVVVAYEAVAAAYELAVDLNTLGKLTPEDKVEIVRILDEVVAGIDAAATLKDVDLSQAEARLTVALQALNALDAYLRSKQ